MHEKNDSLLKITFTGKQEKNEIKIKKNAVFAIYRIYKNYIVPLKKNHDLISTRHKQTS